MIQFAVEALKVVQPDIESLLPAQWAHTGDVDIDCKPNWPLYNQFAERGALMVVVGRDLDQIVGYLAAFIYPHPNSVDRLVAEIPTYFVLNRPTRALVMARMVDYAVEKLAEKGVFKVRIETNAEHSAARLWELRGFKLDRLGYSMQLEKPTGALHA